MPHSVSITMSGEAIKLSQLGDKYLLRFYQLGLSSVCPASVDTSNATAAGATLERSRQYCGKFGRCTLQSMCFFTVVITATVLSFHNLSLMQINFENTIYCVFIICAFATCAMTMHRTVLYGNQSHYLWLAFINYERFVWQRLHIKMTFNAFRKKYNLCVWCTIGQFLILFSATITFRIDDYVRQLAALVLVFETSLIHFQIIFYVILFASVIEFFNQHIVDAGDAIECETSGGRYRKLIAALKNYKFTYYKLYEIAQLINENFGWVIVSLIMQYANNVVLPFYWVIVELHEDDILSNMRILSKYIFQKSN